jgi:site-specific recombinase XerD
MKLQEIIPQYISYRQSLGEKFNTNARELRCFLNYMGGEKDIYDLDLEICTDFLYAPSGKVTANWFCKYSALKGLFEWAIARRYTNNIPLPTDKPKRPENILPYIYSNKELKLLFDAALVFQKNRSRIYPQCIRMVLMLTYMLGLRLHEVVSLKIKDVDCDHSLVQINESKFYKSRIVPFNGKVKHLLIEFMDWRKRNRQPDDSEINLFLDKKNVPVNIDTVRGCFNRIRTKVGISREDDAVYQPRIHDLRHTFAVNRLTSWYREGKDVQKLLPLLSTYLGHKHLAHTSVYLTMTENLLEEANKRFETYINNESHE